MKRIMYVVNNIHYFMSHRQCLAKGASKAGYEIVVASPNKDGAIILKDTPWQHVYFPLSRSGLWPWQEGRSIWRLYHLIKQYQPDLLHLVTIKPVIYGGLIAKGFSNMAMVSAVTGLGYVFTGKQLGRRMLRWIVGGLYQFAFKHQKGKVIFQNCDDPALFVKNGWIRQEQAGIIRGAGVCPKQYPLLAELDAPKPVVVLPARLLKDKGVQEFMAAARQLQGKARFALVGDVDEGNPASLTRQVIESCVAEGVAEWWGWCTNMVEVFRQCHVVCLPSYREGLPRALVEAACCGRAIVTTNVPGCREVVDDGVDGLLVSAGDVGALVDALSCLIADTSLRKQLGLAARDKAVKFFSEKVVVDATLDLYGDLLN